MTPEQCRMARAALNWSIQRLAEKSDVGRNSIARYEASQTSPHNATLKVLQGALEEAGVEFIAENGSGPGVRLSKK